MPECAYLNGILNMSEDSENSEYGQVLNMAEFSMC